MKIRHPLAVATVSRLATAVIFSNMATVRFTTRYAQPELIEFEKPRQRCIFVFWHENILAPAMKYRGCQVPVLISKHSDGEMIAQVVQRFGFGLIRGSTNRGGMRALREMLREAKDKHIAVTPDGPRGPRRIVQPGLAFLSAFSGLPVLPIGVGFRKAWRANSWDRFAIPRPFSKVCILTHPLVFPPTDRSEESLTAYQHSLQQAMNAISQDADSYAEGESLNRIPMRLAGA